MAKPTPESLVMRAIGEYLEYKRYTFWRQNNFATFDVTKHIHRAMPKYSLKGVSDFILLKNGKVYFIEAKAPKGVQSPEQKKFRAQVEEAGAVYILARSLDDLMSCGL